MPAKRVYKNSRRKAAKKYKTTVKRVNMSASALQAAVRRTLFKNAETKQSQASSTDGQEVGHNSFITIANNVVATTPGVQDPGNSNSTNRIGDEITLLKAKFCMMLELNERYSDVSYRILVIKSARGDTPSDSTLWNNLSGNRMLDTINTERYTILYQKWGKIKAPGLGVGYAPTQDATGSGIYYNSNTQGYNNVSRATRIVKFDIPGKKFGTNGKIIYDGAGTQQKFFDYNVLIYAYSNYSTSSLLGFNVLRVNDYYHLLKYKDI